jgi:hypothetical protein
MEGIVTVIESARDESRDASQSGSASSVVAADDERSG